jgi:hypothetical protein
MMLASTASGTGTVSMLAAEGLQHWGPPGGGGGAPADGSTDAGEHRI